MSPIPTFGTYTAQLPALLTILVACTSASRTELAQRIPKNTPGIYDFYHDGQPLYIVRTRDLRRRLGERGWQAGRTTMPHLLFCGARHAAKAAGHTASLMRFSRPALPTQRCLGGCLWPRKRQ